ncbi:MAG: 3-phosphoshikimate 1-carboxyvinyltransferase [Clostridia bacterium]
MLSLEAAGPLRGRVKVPGDKSISHRAAIFGALGEGELRISNFAPGRDVRSTLDLLRALGAGVDHAGTEVRVRGRGGKLSEPEDVLDCGNSGTTMRLMAGVLAAQPFTSILTGDASLRRRPMDRIVDPLTTMGAKISGREGGRFAPLVIRGGSLRGIRHESAVASAQVKSAILLAGLLCGDDTAVAEPARSRDHTERMLRAFGAEVANLGYEIFLEGGNPGRLRPPEDGVNIPGDPSSAAFLVAAALLVPGSEITLLDVGTNPTRTGFLSVVERAGALIVRDNVRQWGGEPVADLRISANPLNAIEVSAEEVPSLIDEIPILALLATRAYGVSVFRGVGELRVKETDRLSAVMEELGALGANMEVIGDDLVVRGSPELRDGEVDARGDHRMAMTLTLASLAGVKVDVSGTAAIDVSYPGFGEDLSRLGVVVRRPRPKSLVGIVGYPARHSLSPAMFRAAFDEAGLDWDYRIFEVPPEDLGAAVEGVRALDLTGVNVTVPHKEAIVKHLDVLEGDAANIGAVNVVVNRDGQLVGHNTDAFGVMDSLRAAGVDPSGASVLLIGAGGAARAAAFALAGAEITSLHVANRTQARAERLAADLASAYPHLQIVTSGLSKVPEDRDVIIQATSVGMGDPEASPLPQDYPFHSRMVLLEMVYRPTETRLTRRAHEAGARVIGGLEMLLRQGERGFELFTGFSAPPGAMRAALREWL